MSIAGLPAYNLLTEPLIRAMTRNATVELMTLPGVFAALLTDEVVTFPALRAHQRHAWHAFLCQLAALALIAAGRTEPWTDEAGWRDGLRALTPEHDDAWCLIGPPDRPALLQAAVPDGLAALARTAATPDALDMLVTSRNHDQKAEVMIQAAPDDWLFALVALQTMEGFLGAGNYGISRMNGGFANRPALGVAPPGGPGAHFSRDVQRLLTLRAAAPAGGVALLWLVPWDGATSLDPNRLDPLYIEICRRVRLVAHRGQIAARTGGSRAARVIATPGGLTRDPWAPLVADKDGFKVFSVSAVGFHYRRMVDLIWPKSGTPAPLQILAPTDAGQGLVLLARGLARGQGKTEGWHERRVPISRLIRGARAEVATDPVAHAARQRVELVGEMRGVLRLALLALFQGGPAQIDRKDKDGERKAEPFLARMDAAVDLDFFDDLATEAEAADPVAARDRWVRDLLRQADKILDQADTAAPKASRRRLRARDGAQSALHGLARRNEKLAPHLKQEAADVG